MSVVIVSYLTPPNQAVKCILFKHLFGKYPFDTLTPLLHLRRSKTVLQNVFKKHLFHTIIQSVVLSSEQDDISFVGLWSHCAI